MRTDLIIIDAQKDFCSDPATPGYSGSLYVPGAEESAEKLAEVISRGKKQIDRVVLTMDSHYIYHIAHPLFWIDSDGKTPDVFTIITHDDVVTGKFTSRRPEHRVWALEYTKRLAANGRYPLCIWPEHCIIGSEGFSLADPILQSVTAWERTKTTLAMRLTKGSNWQTEHYSAVQADVPDPRDPTTSLNTTFINSLLEADRILFSGQALSHCVANTLRDIAANFDPSAVQKMELIVDTTNNVPGFEQQGDAVVKDLTAVGMKVVQAADLF